MNITLWWGRQSLKGAQHRIQTLWLVYFPWGMLHSQQSVNLSTLWKCDTKSKINWCWKYHGNLFSWIFWLIFIFRVFISQIVNGTLWSQGKKRIGVTEVCSFCVCVYNNRFTQFQAWISYTRLLMEGFVRIDCRAVISRDHLKDI